MAKSTGRTVEHGATVYEIDTKGDAINFESCVNGGADQRHVPSNADA